MIPRCWFVVPLVLGLGRAHAQAGDPLPSWSDGPNKQAIVKFVAEVTREGGPRYVRPAERIATFDNDGTLWCEQPFYVQLLFAVDRLKALAPKHPEWKTKQPFQAFLENDRAALGKFSEKESFEIIAATHSGMTVEEFDRIVRDWLLTSRHPRFNRPYTELVYQPMVELLGYLRANGFKTFIVSGGGVEFMRTFAERAYGIPPEQIVGSTIRTEFQLRDGKPALLRLPQMQFIDDGPGKPVGIQQHIGRRPLAAFGNSDGDLEMLQWTAASAGARLLLLVHHDDAEREYAYDRKSPVGRLDKAWDQAKANGWLVVSMKNDWKQIFKPAK